MEQGGRRRRAPYARVEILATALLCLPVVLTRIPVAPVPAQRKITVYFLGRLVPEDGQGGRLCRTGHLTAQLGTSTSNQSNRDRPSESKYRTFDTFRGNRILRDHLRRTTIHERSICCSARMMKNRLSRDSIVAICFLKITKSIYEIQQARN